MGLPEPVAGLVLGYAYLWSDEARRGLTEGRKDRPCVIVLTIERRGGGPFVTVAPVTHLRPADPDAAVALPAGTKARLGLDDQPSWIVASDLNSFVGPGVDLRRTAQDGESYAYGFLPRSLFYELREKVLLLARAGQAALTPP